MCKPLLFCQSTNNRVSFALNASRLVSTMIITPRGISATWHGNEGSDQIPHPLWVVIKCPPRGRLNSSNSLPPGSKRRQMPGVCRGGGCLSFDLTGTLRLDGLGAHLVCVLYLVCSPRSVVSILVLPAVACLHVCSFGQITSSHLWGPSRGFRGTGYSRKKLPGYGIFEEKAIGIQTGYYWEVVSGIRDIRKKL